MFESGGNNVFARKVKSEKSSIESCRATRCKNDKLRVDSAEKRGDFFSCGRHQPRAFKRHEMSAATRVYGKIFDCGNSRHHHLRRFVK